MTVPRKRRRVPADTKLQRQMAADIKNISETFTSLSGAWKVAKKRIITWTISAAVGIVALDKGVPPVFQAILKLVGVDP